MGQNLSSNKFKVDYYGKLEDVIELQYHSEQNKVFLFKYYWYDTTNRGIIVDPRQGLVKSNTKARLHNIDYVFVFIKKCQQVYNTYALFFRNARSKVDWLFIVKTKPRSHVQVVQDFNDELTARDDVFQLDELVVKTKLRGHVQVVQDDNDELTIGDDVFQLDELGDPYRVALYTDLEENSNFYIGENTFVDVEELKDILKTSRHT